MALVKFVLPLIAIAIFAYAFYEVFKSVKREEVIKNKTDEFKDAETSVKASKIEAQTEEKQNENRRI